MKYTLVFIHGLESTSQGNKAQYFRKTFPDMIIEDYTGDFQTRMQKLTRELESKNNLILVGSSYGGLMAARYAADHKDSVKKLILIAPALTIEGFEEAVSTPLEMPVVIYHGTRDDIVSPDDVKRIADKVFTHLEHHLVDDEHPLNNIFLQLNWRQLLEQM